MRLILTHYDRGGHKIKFIISWTVVGLCGLEEHSYQIIRISQYTWKNAFNHRSEWGGEGISGSFRVKIECNRSKNKIVSYRIIEIQCKRMELIYWCSY